MGNCFQLFDNHVIESILRDSRQLLDWIQCIGAGSVNNACNLTRKEDDVNTCPLEAKSSLSSGEREKLKSEIKYYRRKYHQLLQSVDIVTKNCKLGFIYHRPPFFLLYNLDR